MGRRERSRFAGRRALRGSVPFGRDDITTSVRVPAAARGAVVLPATEGVRDGRLTRELIRAGFAVVRFHLWTPPDPHDAAVEALVGVVGWTRRLTDGVLPVALHGTGRAAAPVLSAAVRLGADAAAVVARGVRPEDVPPGINLPALLIPASGGELLAAAGPHVEVAGRCGDVIALAREWLERHALGETTWQRDERRPPNRRRVAAAVAIVGGTVVLAAGPSRAHHAMPCAPTFMHGMLTVACDDAGNHATVELKADRRILVDGMDLGATKDNTSDIQIVSGAGTDTLSVYAREGELFDESIVVTLGDGLKTVELINQRDQGDTALLGQQNDNVLADMWDGVPTTVAGAGMDDALVFNPGRGNDLIDASGAIPGTNPVIARILAGFLGGNNTAIGGQGDDQLFGGPQNDLLIGGLGNDTLTAGAGSDSLTGSAGDDILIGGTTTFDAHEDALLEIMREWTMTDQSMSGPMDDDTLTGIDRAEIAGTDMADRATFSVLSLPVDVEGSPEGDRYVVNLLNDATATVDIAESPADMGMDELEVNGTTDADRITVTNSMLRCEDVVPHGSVEPANSVSCGDVSHAGLEHIRVNGMGGNDQVDVQSAMVPTAVTFGLGQSVLKLGAGRLDQIAAPIEVDGANAAAVALDDSTNPTAVTVTITGTQIGAGSNDNAFGQGGSLTYMNVTEIDAQLGSGGAEVSVPDIDTPAALTFTPGENTLQVGAGSLNMIDAPIEVFGADSTDVVLDDSQEAMGKTAGVTGTEVGARPGDNLFGPQGKLTYADINGLMLRLGTGADFITLLQQALAQEVTIDGGAGDDALDVDFHAGNPVPPAGVVFNGGADADLLRVLGGTFASLNYMCTNPQPHAGAGQLDLDGSVIAFTGLDPVVADVAADDVTAHLCDQTGGAGDQAVLEDAARGMTRLRSLNASFEAFTFNDPSNALAIGLGAGDDTINISGSNGGVALDGGSGSDRASVMDARFENGPDDGLGVLDVESLTITNSTFLHNEGAGIDVTHARRTLIAGSTFDGNRGGGGLFDGGALTIRNSSFDDNQANGVQARNIDRLTIQGSTFAENAGAGVRAEDVDGGLIGGSRTRDRNVVRSNDGAGVESIRSPLGILGNSIFSNGGLGIDAGADGVTPNDMPDGDGIQNFPVLTSAVGSRGRTLVRGTLHSVPGERFVIEFFSSAVADPTGHGEGERFLGSVSVTTNQNGDARFTAQLPVAAPRGHVITSTATLIAPGVGPQTSEFSGAVGFRGGGRP